VRLESEGTIRPPAVTRTPGGEPCSLRSFSALSRLIDGDGEGFLSSGGIELATANDFLTEELPEDEESLLWFSTRVPESPQADEEARRT
jgi:hypothetical protein